MPDQIRDQREMDTAFVQLILVKAPAPHAFAEEKRRLLGVEDGHDEVALESTAAGHGGTDGQADGDGRTVVIGAGVGDRTVVMRSNQHRRQGAIRPGNHAGKVGEIDSLTAIRKGEGIATIRSAADFSESTGDPGFGRGVTWGADHASSRLAEFTDVLFEGCGEGAVGGFHVVRGLHRSGGVVFSG